MTNILSEVGAHAAAPHNPFDRLSSPCLTVTVRKLTIDDVRKAASYRTTLEALAASNYRDIVLLARATWEFLQKRNQGKPSDWMGEVTPDAFAAAAREMLIERLLDPDCEGEEEAVIYAIVAPRDSRPTSECLCLTCASQD